MQPTALSGMLATASSCASTALSSHHDSIGAGNVLKKVKLRLCYGGGFEQVREEPLIVTEAWQGVCVHATLFQRYRRVKVCLWIIAGAATSHAGSPVSMLSPLLLLLLQTATNSYKFVGGEYFNESIPYGIRYADFMFKLSEKFRTAVSVKYLAPGEDLVPDQLISVQDDADLQV